MRIASAWEWRNGDGNGSNKSGGLPELSGCAALRPNPGGSLVPPGFAVRRGTAAPLMLQNCMKEQPILKRFRGASSADGPAITKRPKLVIEMSCRNGTWVHLRCILNATSAPFLESCGPSQPQQLVVRRISRTPSLVASSTQSSAPHERTPSWQGRKSSPCVVFSPSENFSQARLKLTLLSREPGS